MAKPAPIKEQLLPLEVRQRFQELKISRRFSRDPETVRRLLVRVPNWVGDAVMSLPVLAGLRRFFPLAEITVLAARRVAPLFGSQPRVSQVIRYPEDRSRWKVLWELRGQFDLALALPNSLESALGLWLVGVPYRAGYNTDARRPLLNLAVAGRQKLAGLHTVFYFLGLLQAVGMVTTFTPPTLYLEAQEMASAAELLAGAALASHGPWVGLSPGATYGPAKRWPPERFAALGDALQRDAGARLVMLGGPEERPVADRVRECLNSPVLDLVGQTDLRQALGVLSQLRVLITNDSGLMHAAAALGLPLVALFGSTDPVATGPFTHKATVLRHPLPCSPCFKRTCDQNYSCLAAIGVEEVKDAASRWLGETS